MITRQKAYHLRALIEKAAIGLTDEEALTGIELFPAWVADHAYEANDRVRYDGLLYKCFQSHTSMEQWTPDITPALWVEVAPPGVIPVWKQPTGSHDAYMIGDKVHFPTEEDPVYISTMDYNVYAPDVTGWTLIG